MSAKFVIKKRFSQFYFSFISRNGTTYLDSEMYKSKAAIFTGIASLKLNSTKDDRFERCTAMNGRFYFFIKASNHIALARSMQYESEAGRDNAIELVKLQVANAEIEDLCHL